jgi:hypothetical protein
MTTTRPNGKAGAGKLLRMPRRTIKIELEDDYEGFWIDMWSNPPLRLFMEMQDTSDFDKLKEVIRKLIVDWNLVDFDGELIPVGEIEDVSMDLIGQIITRYMNDIQQASAVPKASSET